MYINIQYCHHLVLMYYCIQHPALQGGEGQTHGSRVVDSFSQLYLRDDVVDALESIGVTQPTVIQMLAIPKIAAGKNVLCASETGMKLINFGRISHRCSQKSFRYYKCVGEWLFQITKDE